MRETPGVEFFRHDLGEPELALLKEALAGRFLTTGPLTAQFESRFSEYLGLDCAVGVTSCTAAMHLALLAWEIGPGDEVITTPLTFMASANAILHAGATPVFADVDPGTGNLDPDAVEAALTPRTRAILPVHLYGTLCDMRRLRAVADRHDLIIIEDAAHCVEGRRDGFGPGSLGDAACFSFYATKNLTSGEGGAIAFRGQDRSTLLRQLRLHGMSRDAHDRHHGGSVHYDMPLLGWKYNMDTIQAALLLPQLDRLEENLLRRDQVWSWYDEALADLPDLGRPDIPAGTRSARHLYTRWVDAKIRDAVISGLRARGIGCAVNFLPLHQLSFYRDRYRLRLGQFPRAEAIGSATITLPFYPTLTRSEVREVGDALAATLDEARAGAGSQRPAPRGPDRSP